MQIWLLMAARFKIIKGVNLIVKAASALHLNCMLFFTPPVETRRLAVNCPGLDVQRRS